MSVDTSPERPEPPTDTATVRKRRDEIVAAATEIIATEGIHRLSLARIEGRVRMSRGQLTYYFRSKEKILLAVFDRMLAAMKNRHVAETERLGASLPAAADKFAFVIGRLLGDDGPPAERAQLTSLVHTFLAQVQHRPDYRAKLAEADGELREFIAADIRAAVPDPPVPPAVVASIVMALIQGLGSQLAVNPQAFDKPAMLAAVLRVVAPFFHRPEPEQTHE